MCEQARNSLKKLTSLISLLFIKLDKSRFDLRPRIKEPSRASRKMALSRVSQALMTRRENADG